MFPYFYFFGRAIGLYSIMTLLGVLTGGVYACVLANKNKYDYAEIIIFILYSFVGVVIGSHALYAIINYQRVVSLFRNINTFDTIGKVFNVLAGIFGGSIFYGGLIGCIIVCYLLIRKDRKKIIFMDIVAVNIPLFHFFGRIGCFLGGCCYGIPCKIGLSYIKSPILEANGVIRFPVQLLESVFNLGLFFFMNYCFNSRKFKNNLIYFYLILYAIGRFFIEFLRGDIYRGIWFGVSTSQIISIIMILTVVIKKTIFEKRMSNI